MQNDLILELAEKIHATWRLHRFNEQTKTHISHFRKTNDAKWIAAHRTDEVDLANTEFAELPQDWKDENIASARVAFFLIKKAIDGGQRLNDEFVDEACAVVHAQMMEREGDAAKPEQHVSFRELPEKEKNKDRDVVREAIALFSRQNL